MIPCCSIASRLLPAAAMDDADCSNDPATDCTMSRTAFASCGAALTSPCTRLEKSWMPALTMDGATRDTICGICSAMAGATLSSAVPMPCKICSILGRMLSAAVAALERNVSVSCPRSAFSSAMPVTRFSHAALALLTDPSMVEDASCAVVPVMPISCWTKWMASTISA